MPACVCVIGCIELLNRDCMYTALEKEMSYRLYWSSQFANRNVCAGMCGLHEAPLAIPCVGRDCTVFVFNMLTLANCLRLRECCAASAGAVCDCVCISHIIL